MLSHLLISTLKKLDRFLARITIGLIRCYQATLSPDKGLLSFFLKGRICGHEPHCSAYGLKCLQRYGFWHGLPKISDRILHCTPTMQKIYDPEYYRVVFFSSAPIGTPFLTALHQDPRFEVVGVVTQQDKPVGRGLNHACEPSWAPHFCSYQRAWFAPSSISWSKPAPVCFPWSANADRNHHYAYGRRNGYRSDRRPPCIQAPFWPNRQITYRKDSRNLTTIPQWHPPILCKRISSRNSSGWKQVHDLSKDYQTRRWNCTSERLSCQHLC